MRKPRVFVTDGSYPNCLAAVRALSREGFDVTVGERASIPLSATISFWSRHCAERFRYPDPQADRSQAALAIIEHLKSQRYAAAIPIGLEMTELFVANRHSLAAPTMLPPSESFGIAADKRLTYAHAAALGIPTPRTVPAARWRELTLPVVFKNARSGAIVARTRGEAAAREEEIGPAIERYVAQDYIPGENGFGYFGFFKEGREAGCFMHERLMQYPKEGGPSVVARAVRDAPLRSQGSALLKSLQWHGVAMVEFKRSDADGRLYLMEINPKFWGSLDLAIQAGCNFPAWIVRTLDGSGGSIPNGYREGLQYQWVIPTGLKGFLRYPGFRVQFLRNFVSAGVRTDLQWSDPLPSAAGFLTMLANAAKR
jgi:predicted ATP-grasp superfamily ATP-dependent carboligase